MSLLMQNIRVDFLKLFIVTFKSFSENIEIEAIHDEFDYSNSKIW